MNWWPGSHSLKATPDSEGKAPRATSLLGSPTWAALMFCLAHATWFKHF